MLKELHIMRAKSPDHRYVFNDDKERVEILGSTICIRGGKYGGDIVFLANLAVEDAWSVSDVSADEELMYKISDLSKEALEQVRNFCESAGLFD